MGTIVVQVGNTRITVHSPSGVGEMDRAARQDWATERQAAGSEVICRLAEVMATIHRQAAGGRDENSAARTVDKLKPNHHTSS